MGIERLLTPKRVEQNRQQAVYFDGRRPMRPEAFPEPLLQQTIEDRARLVITCTGTSQGALRR